MRSLTRGAYAVSLHLLDDSFSSSVLLGVGVLEKCEAAALSLCGAAASLLHGGLSMTSRLMSPPLGNCTIGAGDGPQWKAIGIINGILRAAFCESKPGTYSIQIDVEQGWRSGDFNFLGIKHLPTALNRTTLILGSWSLCHLCSNRLRAHINGKNFPLRDYPYARLCTLCSPVGEEFLELFLTKRRCVVG